MITFNSSNSLILEHKIIILYIIILTINYPIFSLKSTERRPQSKSFSDVLPSATKRYPTIDALILKNSKDYSGT